MSGKIQRLVLGELQRSEGMPVSAYAIAEKLVAERDDPAFGVPSRSDLVAVRRAIHALTKSRQICSGLLRRFADGNENGPRTLVCWLPGTAFDKANADFGVGGYIHADTGFDGRRISAAVIDKEVLKVIDELTEIYDRVHWKHVCQEVCPRLNGGVESVDRYALAPWLRVALHRSLYRLIRAGVIKGNYQPGQRRRIGRITTVKRCPVISECNEATNQAAAAVAA